MTAEFTARTRVTELIANAPDSHAEIAEKVGVDKSLVTRWRAGSRTPSAAKMAALERLYGPKKASHGAAALGFEAGAVAAAFPWLRKDSPLAPWLQRLLHDGTSLLEDDADAVERTVRVVACTCAEQPAIAALVIADVLEKHPDLLADVLAALRPYA